MKKNVSGQNIEIQMNSRTDGSPLTADVSVYVTGDGGSQTGGTGTLTHKGNGAWNYAPAQAETNYSHIAFTFTHATGVNQTINVYTGFPQTGDVFAGTVNVNVASIDGDTGVATTLKRSLSTCVVGTVDDTNFTPTTTEFETPSITTNVTDLIVGRAVVFATGSGTLEAGVITAYSVIGGKGHITIGQAMPVAPANGNIFILI